MSSLSFNAAEFERQLLRRAQDYIRAALLRQVPRVRVQVQEAVDAAVRGSPEYHSLLAGDLRALFGIAQPQPVLEAIVGAVRNSVHVTFTPPRGAVLGGLQVSVLRRDLSDVLAVPGGSYVSRSTTRNTDILVPWLEWLLLVGDRVVVTDFEVKTGGGGFSGTRTGQAVMVQPRRRGPRGFQVPSGFSGTVDNNWLTRCLGQVVGPVQAIFEGVLRSL